MLVIIIITFEHTTQMTNAINQARIIQRPLGITLLDLKNAFGKVHHNLIPEILKYHHIPEHIQQLDLSLYSNFQTSILTSTFQTLFITVGQGVLQGDCVSPFTFNICCVMSSEEQSQRRQHYSSLCNS